MKKKLLIAAAALLALVLTVPAVTLGPYALRVQRFEADPDAGYHAPFFLYVSSGAHEAARDGATVVILVQPNNSGTTSDDPEVHETDAWWTGFGRRSIAEELGVVLLVPAFVRPAVDWRIYTHALDRDVLTTERQDLARLDLQLLAMIDHARTDLADGGIPTDRRVLIQGYSASGMFANRFAVLHPGRVMAVAAGSPGGWPVAPLATWMGHNLPYPAGVADLDDLTGEPFDSAAYSVVPQLIVMGDRDDNDSIDFRDGWDEDSAALVDSLFGTDPLARWEPAQAAYRAAGADVRFILEPGVGHDRRALQHHTTRFFDEILTSDGH